MLCFLSEVAVLLILDLFFVNIYLRFRGSFFAFSIIDCRTSRSHAK